MRVLTPFPLRSVWPRLCLAAAASAALGACMVENERVASNGSPAATGLGVATDRPAATPATPAMPAMAARPGNMMTGSSIALMSRQYQPRLGATAGTGASAWVRAAPPPAFVATGPAPPADPPAPPPAAVANRQPSAPAGRPAGGNNAADLVRPEAAQSQSSAPELQAAAQPPRPAQAALSAADLAKGRQLFSDFSCGACHVLADARGGGGIGPGLDNNPRLTREYAAGVIHDGRGAMPSFAGQISDPDIATLAAYIVQVSRK